MIRRLIAYFIDWYLVLIVMNTVLIAAAYVLSGTVYVGSLPLTYFDADVQLPLLLVLVCIEVLFYCVIPRFAWRGQTIGKKLLRLRVTRADGEPAGLPRLLLRDLVAVALIEGCFSPLSNYVRNYLMLFFERDIIQYTVWFSWGAGAISVLVLLFTKRRMLHDFIAGTAVSAAAADMAQHPQENECRTAPSETAPSSGEPVDDGGE